MTAELRIATAYESDAGADLAARLCDPVAAVVGRGPTTAVLFASAHFEEQVEEIGAAVYERLAPRCLAGMTGESVIANDREYENQPGIVLWAAQMPGAQAVTFHLSQDDLGRLDSPAALREHLGVSADDQPSFILLVDPYSVNAVHVLERLERAYPSRPVFGGQTSAAEAPGQSRLLFDGQCLRHGAVGIAFTGDVRVDGAVSQGCRPIARHLVITRADKNVIHELGGRAAVRVLEEILRECPREDMALLTRPGGLLVGRAVNEAKPSFDRGDFVIRNLVGLDQESGTIAINDLVKPGQTVQFHVRDARSASEDLRTTLDGLPPSPAGALLFTCNGRGRRMFSSPHHDAHALSDARGAMPVAGMFCAGEIGPVGGRNYLHGHTASVALFSAAERAPRRE